MLISFNIHIFVQLKQQKYTTMSRTKNYIEDLMGQGIDVLNENSSLDFEYYELIASTEILDAEHIHTITDGRN